MAARASATSAIRPLAPRDARELVRLRVANRRFMAPYEPERPDSYYTLAGQREMIRTALARQDDDVSYSYVILDGDAVAGAITLSNVVRGALQSANVGYWVDRGRNGRGLATRAVAAAIDVAFSELRLHRLEAGTLLDNVASQRVLEKNGFERIGIARNYLHIGGAWRDHILFQRTVDR
jgi:ribosomal-protein-alanine N-acetyltransferase